MPPSASVTPFNNSVMRGSTLADKVIKEERAVAPCILTLRLGSWRDLIKVVWSWGRKGLRVIPPFKMSRLRVFKMAALTSHEKRSPMIRIRGPIESSSSKKNRNQHG